MTDTLRPPPYRPRPKEGETDREAPLTEEQLHTRDSVIVAIGIVAGIGVYAGLVLLLRELPGGGLPYELFLGMIPSIVYWLAAMLLTALWVGRRDRKRRIAGLLFVLTAFAACSLLGIAIKYEGAPALWWQEFWMKFGR